ncbi:MAG: sugar transferase [Actinobacteria bacterium]|nr:sugar transferase [Actinomycetota bacterium]
MKRRHTVNGPLKRGFDIIGSAVMLGLASPVLLVLALLVRLRLGRPILFSQLRPGRGAGLFTLYKVRTMTDAKDDSGALLQDAERLTRLGRFLRSTSLDELPELYNVLRGDMSLVGPRPLSPTYLALYPPHFARRHECRPGITGLAQVSGRNALSWEERFTLDVWYIDHHSMALDLRVLGRTVVYALRRTHVAPGGTAEIVSYTGPAAPEE